LSELGDVSIVSPSNGQVLVYNSTTSKWENSSAGFVPYVGAVTTVDLGAQGLRAGYVRFNTSVVSVPDEQGIMFWDADDETIDVILNGYIMKIGEDQFYPVKNQTGSSIAKGTAVRFAGTVGASGRLLIAPFIADGSVSSSFFMGVTAEAIADGADGKVLYFGRIRGINTNAFNEGDVLYASTTVAGGFQTAVPVAPNNIVQVAAVINKSINQGVIFIRPSFSSNINQDEGVKIVSPTTGQLLQLQANGLWENKTTAQVLGGTSSQFVKGDGSLDSTAYGTGTVTSVGLSSATSGVTIGSTPITTSGTITLAIATASGSQNGLLSSTDWTTFNSKIGGNLATGQVAFGTAANTIGGDNGLFWDNTNKRLGVGTNAPTYKTQINSGASSLTMRLQADAGINPTLSFLRGLTDIAQINGAFDGLQLNGFQVIRFDTVATERWRINIGGVFESNGAQTIRTSTGNLTLATAGGNGNILLTPNGTGNVGIGTSSPIYKLNVHETSDTDVRIQLTNGGTGTGVSNGFQIIANGSSQNFQVNLLQRENGAIGFWTSNIQQMLISSTGNLLLNTTTNAGFRLDVNGTARVQGALTLTGALSGTSASFTGGVTIGSTFNINTESWLQFLGNNVLLADGDFTILQASGTGLIRFRNNSAQNLLTLANNGAATFISTAQDCFTINTTNSDGPVVNIQNSGTNIGTFGNAEGVTNGGVTNFAVRATNNLIFSTGGANPRMTITSGGNVLIGTTTDNGQRLQISGGASTALRLDADSGVPALNIGSGATISVDAPGIAGGRFLLTSSGNVLIGTTTDSGYKLEVQTGSTSAALWVQTGGTTNSYIIADFRTGANLSALQIQGNGTIFMGGLGTGTVYSNGGNLTNSNPSDLNLKDKVEPINYGLDEILKLNPVSFHWKNDRINQGKQYGFIAQEVQKIMPDLVKKGEYLGLDKEAIFTTLVKAIQELKQEIDTLKN
jgi:hypothetical protein